jgi:heat shock protein HtpX
MRIVLFLLTNLLMAVVVSVVVGVALSVFGIKAGSSIAGMAVMCVLYGMIASFISLLISRWMAKWSMNVTLINGTESQETRWLYDTIAVLAQRANIPMPEVGIYEGDANAFATGPSKNASLVAVSSGLLHTLSNEEIEAVLAHEVAHIANGDMVTMTLIQGVVNAFTMFLARLVTWPLRDENGNQGFAGMMATMVLDIVFGIAGSLVVAWASRQREFRADWGAAQLLGQSHTMQSALMSLNGVSHGEMPGSLKTLGISPSSGMSLFSTHPSLEERIASLQRFNQ